MTNRFTVSQKEAGDLGDALEWFADQPGNENTSDDARELGDHFAEVSHRGTGVSFRYENHVSDAMSAMAGEILDGLFDDQKVLQKFPSIQSVSNRWVKYALGESIGENKQMKKKSAYRVIAEGIALGNLPKLPTNSLKYRRLQKEELTNLVAEEFCEAKKMEDMKVKELPFASAELASEMNWAKTLGLDKAFKK